MRVADYEVLEELLRTDWQLLCRARERGGGVPVLLKLSRRRPPRPADLALLRHEFELLQNLSIAGVPKPLAVSEAEENCSLALEDSGGEPLYRRLPWFAANLDRFFPLAVELCAVLAALHRANVIYRNFNPRAILVDAAGGNPTLADFSLATASSGGMHHPLGSVVSPLTLPYCSPEQTGRMNREVDHRTDFYSLGVTLYELLTGAPPFESPDQLELIHWHIARTPASPSERRPEIPEPLSQLVLKLLSKTPEERYQSAAGIRHDLEICAREWAAARTIRPFPLGRRDVSDRFLIPQRLYGREQEVRRLATIFEQVSRGCTALALVAGYSGIGKTSLIQGLYRPIVRQKGYFLSGKFDQVVRNIPYGAVLQALRGLVRQLLAESEERLAGWRQQMNAALGANGGVLTEVIPELALILGEQAPPPALGPTEAQNRFQMAFDGFLSVLARKEHPLVIFLDDLQWADSATLTLLESLLSSRETRSLLWIGAYRDNEVDAGHPLLRAVRRLESAGAEIHRLSLGPLSFDGLTAFISDTLHQQRAEAEVLARLISQKTAGNPFFVIQFLKTLHQEGFLDFDYARGRWTYQMEAIARAAITDNVVDLMIRKIQRLAPPAQRTLPLAACIGNEFSLSTLAVITEQTPEAALEDLRQALREGLIYSVGASQDFAAGQAAGAAAQSCAFLHDRVQQAAYALIPQEQKQRVRLRVGRLLLECRAADSEEGIFDVVEHLNFGSPLITDPEERRALAQLNLTAARRAKSSAAYGPALGYLRAGLEQLDEALWDSDYALMFGLQIEAAECEYLCGEPEAAEIRFGLLLERARTAGDKAEVHHLRLVQSENMSRYADAVQCGKEGLQLLGVLLPDAAGERQAALERELASIQKLLGGRAVECLVDLPSMQDPEKRVVMRLLTSIWAPSYITGNQLLTRLISATIVRLSLEHGSTEESAYGYVTHAITVGPVRGDYQAAYQWGRLALSVDERFRNPKQRAKIHQQFHAHVNLWRQPLETCIPHAREACRSGLETGDFNYAAYGAFTESWAAFPTCRDLERFVLEQSSNLALLHKMRMTDPLGALTVIVNWARALQGQTAGPLSLSTHEFDEDRYRESYAANPFFMTPYYVMKLSLDLTFEAYEPALEAALRARQVSEALSGTIWPVLLDFLYGIAAAALYREATAQQQSEWKTELAAIQQSLDRLAANCAANFGCFAALLRAERARIDHSELDAIDAYEQAISGARAFSSVQHGALANELYSRFWRARGSEGVANHFLREAAQLYSQWGATAKVRALEDRWPGLRAAAPAHAASPSADLAEPAPSSPEPAQAALDLATVTKAAQAISQQIELESLLEQLMKIALENAGAQRGLFFSEKDGALLIEAEGWVDREHVQVLQSTPFQSRADFSRAVVQYVYKTGESLVLGEAPRDERFCDEAYVAEAARLSILCAPVVFQGKLQGVLYLENRLAGETFTPARARLMQLLASQAAISLENARLYREMKLEADWRRQAEQMLRSVVEGTASVTGGVFFSSLVHHLASALGVRYAFVTQCEDGSRARMLAFWKGDESVEGIEYDTGPTPCRTVLEGQPGFYPEQVQKLFPLDQDLVDLDAQSYLGIPMFGASGQIIGHLAVLDVRPMTESPRRLSVLRIFAARAAAELERLQAENDLRAALAEVERLKNRLQAENVYLQEEIRREHNFEEIVGSSPVLLDLLSQVEHVAPTDSTVLIYGETGTGKELIARAIHNRSKRRERPLVKVNCGAISAGLVESELFGHVKGAFTGALERRTGRFELANGGTVFLDEVGELPLETQVKLLRVLQEQEFEPVGSSRTTRVDVRVIAATNRDLDNEVAAGRFRADLFYRLNVLPLSAPPLRARPGDIPQLVAFFLSRFSRKFGKKMDSVAQETMQRLVSYAWPGNIRELQNIIERAFVLSQGPILSLGRDLLPVSGAAARASASAGAGVPFAPLAGSGPLAAAPQPSGLPQAGPHEPQFLSTALNDVAKQHILAVLRETAWVIEGPNGAARLLRLHPNTLRSRLKKLGIERPAHEIS
jgi:predicted ATPase/transcriptional regulator with GAF, ATPase, and Fis domain